jgi:uncharacterized membrane protein
MPGTALDRLRKHAIDASCGADVGKEPAMTKSEPNLRHHPAVLDQAQKRAADVELRIADQITAFAGSMKFVYLHVILFGTWMLVFENRPWPTLTLAVSLEAIFLSTFVMIGQNRQAAFQQEKADHDYAVVDKLLVENTELTRSIHALTEDVHTAVLRDTTSQQHDQ